MTTALTTQESLLLNIERGVSWLTQCTDSVLRYHPLQLFMHNDHRRDVPPKGYSEQDMAQLDPRLPGVLRTMQAATPGEYLSGRHILMTLKLWGGKFHRIEPDMFLAAHRVDYANPAMFSVQRGTEKDGTLSLLAHFHGHSVEQTGQGVEYVTANMQPSLKINLEWLTQYYPAWQQAVLMADTLGLSDDEFAQLLLFSSEQKQLKLPAISFPLT